MRTPVKGLVLTGGRSQRMGFDKAGLEFHGRPQWLHALDLFDRLGLQGHVSCRVDQQLHFPAEQRARLITDTYFEVGPLGGLLSAFRQDPSAAWLVIGCDQVLLTEAVLAQLIEHRGSVASAFTGAAPGFRYEPLPSLWEPSAYPLIRDLRSLSQALQSVEATAITPIDARALIGVNTPEELAALRNGS